MSNKRTISDFFGKKSTDPESVKKAKLDAETSDRVPLLEVRIPLAPQEREGGKEEGADGTDKDKDTRSVLDDNIVSLSMLEPGWLKILQSEESKAYWPRLMQFISSEVKQHGKKIYPPIKEVFSAFNLCPLDSVKVIIIGQDPYHGPGQAHGLSFSVKPGIQQPPSLRNMIKLAVKDVGIKETSFGSLEKWAQQGVFMLNAVLTVRHKEANSHKGKGWEQFTDAAIRELGKTRKNLVFLLWGKPAQEKAKLINKADHCILESVHPSPLSSHRGFFDCAHFSKANEYLASKGMEPIDWSLQ